MELKRTYSKYIVGALFSFGLPFMAQAGLHTSTGSTDKVGGSGGSRDSGTCGPDFRMSGVKIKHGDVIDTINFRCTPISSTGGWGGNHFWQGYSKTSAPLPGKQSKSALCPSDKFIGSLRGWTKNNVLNKLQFKCYKSDSDGKRISSGNNSISVRASTGGTRTVWKYCPDGGFASNSYAYRGWHVDAVKFECLKGTLASLSRPNLLSPGNNATVPTNANKRLTWNNVIGASYYRLYLKDQANGQFISPRTGANISSSTYTRVESNSYTMPSAALTFMSRSGNGRNVSWWVQACPDPDNSNNCKAATPRVFKVPSTTAPTQLAKPILRSPANGVTVAPNTSHALIWEFVNGADSYLITLRSRTTGAYLDPNTGNETASATTARSTGNELILSRFTINKLHTKGDIEWKVKACPNRNNSSGCGQYTSPRRFSVWARKRR